MQNTTLEPRTKILMMLIAGCLVILLDSPIALLVCFLGSLTLIALSRPTWRQIGLLCVFLFFTTWGLIYSQAIFYNEFPRTTLFTLVPPEFPIIGKMTGGIRVYREGLFHGIVQSLRFNTTLGIGCFHRLDDTTAGYAPRIGATPGACNPRFYGDDGTAFHSSHSE